MKKENNCNITKEMVEILKEYLIERLVESNHICTDSFVWDGAKELHESFAKNGFTANYVTCLDYPDVFYWQNHLHYNIQTRRLDYHKNGNYYLLEGATGPIPEIQNTIETIIIPIDLNRPIGPAGEHWTHCIMHKIGTLKQITKYHKKILIQLAKGDLSFVNIVGKTISISASAKNIRHCW